MKVGIGLSRHYNRIKLVIPSAAEESIRIATRSGSLYSLLKLSDQKCVLDYASFIYYHPDFMIIFFE
jgi:hypothetical protein